MLFALIVLIVLILGLILFWTVRNGIGPTPTSLKTKRMLMSHLPTEVTGTIIEAGSGWGTLVFPLAARYPDHQVIGYENSLIPYLVSRMVYLIYPMKNLHLVYADFWKQSFEDAGLVVCYLYPGAMFRMSEKCEKELAPGAWVISNTFALPNWKPFYFQKVNDIYKTRVFFYLLQKI